jgi:hypothetical protein
MLQRRLQNVLPITLITLIIVIGALNRALTFDWYLPAISQVDDTGAQLISLYWRHDPPPLAEALGRSQEFNIGIEYAPPLLFWMIIWTQRAVEQVVPYPVISDYVYASRMLTAVLGTLTLIGLAWSTFTWVKPLGATAVWLATGCAALVWSLNPGIINLNNLPFYDSQYSLFLAVAFGATVIAIRHSRPAGALVALLAAIGAIYAKYFPVYTLWLPLCAVVVLIYKRGWRAMFGWLVGMGALSLASGAWLIWGHGMFKLDIRETDVFFADGFRPEDMLANLRFLADYTVGLTAFVIFPLLGLVADRIAAARRLPRLHAGWWVVWLPFVLADLFLFSGLEVANTWDRMRYLMPFLLIWCMTFGWSIAQTYIVMKDWLRQQQALALRLVILGISPFVIWMAVGAVQQIVAYSQPSPRVLLWEWINNSLTPEGKTIVPSRSSSVAEIWDRTWGGYNGALSLQTYVEDNPQRQSLEAWQAEGVTHLIVTDNEMSWGRWRSPDIHAWLDSLTLLKIIPRTGSLEEPYAIYFYQLVPPQVAVSQPFEQNIVLEGYDLAVESTEVVFRPYWRADFTPTDNYQMFVHLYPAADSAILIAQADSPPAHPNRPTLSWDDPLELVVGSAVNLPLPADLPPGDYLLGVGLYNYQRGNRLLTLGGEDRYFIPITLEDE